MQLTLLGYRAGSTYSAAASMGYPYIVSPELADITFEDCPNCGKPINMGAFAKKANREQPYLRLGACNNCGLFYRSADND